MDVDRDIELDALLIERIEQRVVDVELEHEA
jgi:hypothetical protein